MGRPKSEFVGGPLDGDTFVVKVNQPQSLSFLSKPHPGRRPFVHCYSTLGRGRDLVYEGARDYDKRDAGQIVGVVP